MAATLNAPFPLVTLTTDFGTTDHYVAVMKAAILNRCGSARLIDVTHQVPRHDVLCGGITLERAVDGFPEGTVHLAVVDPGVGSKRRLLIVGINGQHVVCPDNGLITWTWRRLGPGKAFAVTWRPRQRASAVFHGRDILGPVAGMLACATQPTTLADPIDDPVLLDVAPAAEGARAGEVVHVDHFGNATTNIPHDALRGRRKVRVTINGRNVGSVRRTYSDVPPGSAVALIGSSGLLEIAVRDSSAASVLGVRVGDRVAVSR